MLNKIMTIAIAVGALTLNTPVASATGVAVDCNLTSIILTGTGNEENPIGVAYGYIVSDAGETVTVRCEVRVDGNPHDSTNPGSGTGAAVTVGALLYSASDTQDVDICAVYTVNGGPETAVCGETTTTHVPPQEFWDLVNWVHSLVVDVISGLEPIICAVLQTAGVPTLVNRTTRVTRLTMDADDCDIYFDGIRLYDFVPYNDY